MERINRSAWVSVTVAIVMLAIVGVAHATQIVNIGATPTGSGYHPGTGTPQVGDPIVSYDGVLNQLTLDAGTYTIVNATGMAGANPSFTGWQYNNDHLVNNWVWNFVIADDATDKVLLYATAGGGHLTQADIASQPDVQNFSTTLTLPATTTLDFMIKDYYLPDNAGGVAIAIDAVTTNQVPDSSSTLWLLIGTVGAMAMWRQRYRHMRL